MNSKKIMIAFGTRPEAIKMCPLVHELKARAANICVCNTGQHRELMSGIAEVFDVKADVELDLMREGQTAAEVVSRVIAQGEKIIKAKRPHTVIVHGDTATALGMAQAAFLSGVRVAHVEAGLRSGDMHAPFPEEFNRRAVTLMSDIHFAPTRRAAENLLHEGVCSSRVHVTGNTVVDALKYTLKEKYTHPLLEACTNKRIIFLTAHRRESQGETMKGMLRAVRRICKSFPDIRVIFPIHPSPAVRACAQEVLGDCREVIMTPPLSVVDCHNIMMRSDMILTDSGGLQEEAAAMGKPVLVMRNTTERPEGILSGIARLAGTDSEQIFATAAQLLSNQSLYKKMCASKNPYGDGKASKKIAEILLKC